jgi:RNA polymerase sigma-70 factor (ECF subfamily)
VAFNQTDADDLYQQTYLRILEMPGKIDLTDNPAGFLMSVAVRIWRDEQKKRARRQKIIPLHDEPEAMNEVPDEVLTEGLVEQKQMQTDIRDAVRLLSEPLRVPLLLYYMGNLPLGEIARSLRIPEGTVKSRLHQARQRIKSELEGIGYGG